MKVKYLVAFESSRRVGSENRTKIQFFQYYASSAQEAYNSAMITAENLGKRSGENWIIEGVYCKCNL